MTGVLKYWNGSAWTELEISGVIGPPGQWTDAQTVTTKTASYTLLTEDVGKLVLFDSATAVNCTIDGSLNLLPGQRIDVLQISTGQVTFVASSATVNARQGLKLNSQYSAATIICIATDSYVIIGDLSA